MKINKTILTVTDTILFYPRMARIFTQIGHSEELGTGISKVYKYSKPYSGSDKIVFNEEDIFITEVPLSVYNNKVPDEVPDKVPDNLTEYQKKIMTLIDKNKKISMSEMSKIVGISKRKILDNINKLKDRNLLKRIGKPKTGYWKIIE